MASVSVACPNRELLTRFSMARLYLSRLILIAVLFATAFAISLTITHARESDYFDLKNALGSDSVYLNILALLDEPVLSRPNDVNYAVRVIAASASNPGIYASLLIERKRDGTMTSIFKRQITTGEGNRLKRIAFRGRRLTAEEFSKLMSEIERQNFFSVGDSDFVATGGVSLWLIEVYDGKRYHAADREGVGENENTAV